MNLSGECLPTTKNSLPIPKPSGCPDSCLDELYFIRDSDLKGNIVFTGSGSFLFAPRGRSSHPPLIQSVVVPPIGKSAQHIEIAMEGPGVKISIDPRGFISVENRREDNECRVEMLKGYSLYTNREL